MITGKKKEKYIKIYVYKGCFKMHSSRYGICWYSSLIGPCKKLFLKTRGEVIRAARH